MEKKDETLKGDMSIIHQIKTLSLSLQNDSNG
jgi:hypothetical protein